MMLIVALFITIYLLLKKNLNFAKRKSLLGFSYEKQIDLFKMCFTFRFHNPLILILDTFKSVPRLTLYMWTLLRMTIGVFEAAQWVVWPTAKIQVPIVDPGQAESVSYRYRCVCQSFPALEVAPSKRLPLHSSRRRPCLQVSTGQR